MHARVCVCARAHNMWIAYKLINQKVSMDISLVDGTLYVFTSFFMVYLLHKFYYKLYSKTFYSK